MNNLLKGLFKDLSIVINSHPDDDYKTDGNEALEDLYKIVDNLKEQLEAEKQYNSINW